MLEIQHSRSVAEEFLVLVQKANLSASNQSVLVSAKKVRVNQCLCQSVLLVLNLSKESASKKFVSIRVHSWLIFSAVKQNLCQSA